MSLRSDVLPSNPEETGDNALAAPPGCHSGVEASGPCFSSPPAGHRDPATYSLWLDFYERVLRR